ncbi:MAG: hypothetical protein ABJF10_01265 [Chthoniobacter sp.]|uniref:hypothetical protein n=1 Tax=Chthoniobacter sp. TaxID=2510640 RepID=UPI0032AB47AF
MILTAFTILHALISLVGIFSGFVVLSHLITSRYVASWTTVFLWTTVATSMTGFFFPVQHFMPSHAVGILSLLLLALAIYALRSRQLAGGWRKTYVITAVMSLYLNFFVLIVQSFLKIPALKALAPTQTEPPFKIAQLTALVLFIVLGFLAAIRFRAEPPAKLPA